MIWQSWKITKECEPPDAIEEQLVAEARRAVRDFRVRQLPVMAPASGKLTREMVLRAWSHVYEPRPRLPVHPDEYARMKKEAEEVEARVNRYQFTRELAMPVFDLEADSCVAQVRWYMERVVGYRWFPWYEPPIRNRHEEPPSRSHFVITRLDE